MEEFIREICEELQIDVPKISYDTSMFPTETTMAMMNVRDNVIHLSNVDSYDRYLAVSHELRHAWQHKYHKDWFKGYKHSSELSLFAYNLQKVELDAHAYSVAIMEWYFGVTPVFEGFPKELINLIKQRADEV